jgi:uncharacterized repeat protein (TIGR02543 family)
MVKLLNRSWIYVVAMIVLFIALLVALVSPIAAPSQLVVAFDSAGGTPVSMVSLPSRGRLATIPSTSKEGYSFDHWLKGTEEVTLETIFTENTTLRAKFDEIIYTITYDTNGGTLIESEELGYGAKLRLPIPVKDDAVFVGWFKDEALTDPASTDSFEVMRDHTFYAKWSELGEDLFTVSFFSEGLGLIESMLIAPNGSVTLITPPTREGYRFLNWVNGINFQPVTGTSISITQDMVFFAQWEIIAGLVTITFDTQGGSAVPSMQLPLGSTWQDPEQIPVLAEGYQFLSWITNCNFDGFEVSCTTLDETYVVEGNMTVLAKYDYMIPLSTMRFETHTVDNRIIGYELSSIDYFTDDVISTLILPARFSGLPITRIGEDAFNGIDFIDKVIIPENILRIDSYAFANSSIKEIFLPDSLKVIRDSAFRNSSLEVVHLGPDSQLQEIHGSAFRSTSMTTFAAPRTLEYIGNQAFQSTPLTAVSFPLASKLNFIGDRAFSQTALTTIQLPEGLFTLNTQAFENTSSLTSIYLPSSLRFIGRRAFRGTGLTSVQYGINAQIQELGDDIFGSKVNGTLIPLLANDTNDYLIVGPIFVGYQGPVGPSVPLVIPEGVVAITNGINFNVEPLEFSSVTLPSTLNFIGRYAFEYATIGSTLTIPSLNHIQENAFYGVTIDGNLVIEGFERVGYQAFANTTIDHVQFTSTLKAREANFGDGMFANSVIQTLTMAEGYKELPYDFTISSNIQAMYLPDSIESINTNAIGSSTLTDIVFEGSNLLINVSSNAISSSARFSPWYVQSMPYIVLKNNLVRYDGSGISAPHTINVPNGVKIINEFAVNNITSILSINYNEVEYIRPYAFYFQWNQDISLLTPSVFTNLKYLGYNFTRNVRSLLTSGQLSFANDIQFDPDFYMSESFSRFDYAVSIPFDNNGFQILGNMLLSYNPLLDLTPEEVTIPETIEIIHNNAFSNVTFSGTFTLSSNIKMIGSYSFSSTRFNGNIVFPSGLRLIDSGAFYDSNLTEVHLPSSVERVNGSAFDMDTLSVITFEDPASMMLDSYFLGSLPESITEVSSLWRPYLNGQFLIMDGVLLRYFGYQKHVVIPDGVTNILSSAFEYRKNTVESITLSSTVTSIANYAFEYLNKLVSIDFSRVVALAYVGYNAFSRTRIVNITITAPITFIHHDAFRDMAYLESVNLGNHPAQYFEYSYNVNQFN